MADLGILIGVAGIIISIGVGLASIALAISQSFGRSLTDVKKFVLMMVYAVSIALGKSITANDIQKGSEMGETLFGKTTNPELTTENEGKKWYRNPAVILPLITSIILGAVTILVGIYY
jgi:hypothetical protein